MRYALPIITLLAFVTALPAADPPKIDLSDYKTVETATTTRVSMALANRGAGYLGVIVAADERGRLVVSDVQVESPGAKAGLQKGDVVVKFAGQAVSKPEVFRELLQTTPAGESVELAILRGDKTLDVKATLGTISRPMRMPTQRVDFGAALGEPNEDEGWPVDRVTPGSPAATAGLKMGDFIIKIDGTPWKKATKLPDLLLARKPGDKLALTVRRDGKDLDVDVTLTAASREPRTGRDSTPLTLWKKEKFRLAVVCVEFADIKHNAKVDAKDWEEALFSLKTHVKNNATGQQVFGSLNDYYHEQSNGALKVEGKVFDWVEVSKKRADYSQGTGTSNKSALLVEALQKLVARDGNESIKEFDGFFFLYAGDRVQTNRGALYYPHASSVNFQSKSWPYLLAGEGGARMNSISGFSREFGFVLGLPDLAARTENAGSEGAGVWCAMSNLIPNSRPQHLSAWCKEQLGWLKPAVIDPTVKQKLILAPIEDSAKDCYKVLVKPDGSEYLLLENRRKKGFDADLPGEGMLIWRVVNNRPILEESHGVEGPSGPRVFLQSVPFPSAHNNSFTPLTTPSSKSPQGGGLPVHITEIRRLSDGRITFHVGYEYQ